MNIKNCDVSTYYVQRKSFLFVYILCVFNCLILRYSQQQLRQMKWTNVRIQMVNYHHHQTIVKMAMLAATFLNGINRFEI